MLTAAERERIRQQIEAARRQRILAEQAARMFRVPSAVDDPSAAVRQRKNQARRVRRARKREQA